jgi:hypothetical protein
MGENPCRENAIDVLRRILWNYKPRTENAEDTLPRTAWNYNPCRENGKGRLLRTARNYKPAEQRDKRKTKEMHQGNCEVATGMNLSNLQRQEHKEKVVGRTYSAYFKMFQVIR